MRLQKKTLGVIESFLKLSDKFPELNKFDKYCSQKINH